MATEFTDLGLVPDEVRDDLFALGLIDDPTDTTYDDTELKSIRFVANIVMQAAISEQTTEIQTDLTSYQIEVDKLEGMQNVLNNLRDQVLLDDSDNQDLIDFIETEETFFDIEDASVVDIDYTAATTVSGTTHSASYETLQDYIEALANNEEVDDEYTILMVEMRDAFTNGAIHGAYDSSGNQFGSPAEAAEDIDNGTAYFLVSGDDSEGESPDHFLTIDEFKNYLIAKVMQEAGYIGDEVYVEPIVFASDDQPPVSGLSSLLGLYASDWVQLNQLYYGTMSIDYDVDEGSVRIDYSGTAALREMGIDFNEYFIDGGPDIDYHTGQTTKSRDADVSTDLPLPLQAEENTYFIWEISSYAYGAIDTLLDYRVTLPAAEIDDSGWESHVKSQDLSQILEDEDGDTLALAIATKIDSQSTITDVALLAVNSAITEWGELNDVWDVIHEYCQEALRRPNNNY